MRQTDRHDRLAERGTGPAEAAAHGVVRRQHRLPRSQRALDHYEFWRTANQGRDERAEPAAPVNECSHAVSKAKAPGEKERPCAEFTVFVDGRGACGAGGNDTTTSGIICPALDADSPAPKFRILKIHRAETGAEIRGLRYEMSVIPRQRSRPSPLTLGNVDTPPNTGNGRRETVVAGRTAMCRIRARLRTTSIGDLEQHVRWAEYRKIMEDLQLGIPSQQSELDLPQADDVRINDL
jgi:hypothetical protein